MLCANLHDHLPSNTMFIASPFPTPRPHHFFGNLTLSHLRPCSFLYLFCLFHKKSLLNLSTLFATPLGILNRDMYYIGRFVKHFALACHLWIVSYSSSSLISDESFPRLYSIFPSCMFRPMLVPDVLLEDGLLRNQEYELPKADNHVHQSGLRHLYVNVNTKPVL